MNPALASISNVVCVSFMVAGRVQHVTWSLSEFDEGAKSAECAELMCKRMLAAADALAGDDWDLKWTFDMPPTESAAWTWGPAEELLCVLKIKRAGVRPGASNRGMQHGSSFSSSLAHLIVFPAA